MIASRTSEGAPAVARSLADLLTERDGPGGAVRSRGGEVERLARALWESLESLHAAGRVHGALRPSVFQVGADGVVTLLPGADSSARAPRLRYAAPEVARGEEPTAAADVFSLALITLELHSGRAARAGDGDELAALAMDGIATIPEALPERLGGLAVRSTAVDPALRPTAGVWRAALERPAARRRGPGPLAVVMAAAVVVLAGLLGLDRRRSAEASERSATQLLASRAAFEGLLLGTYDELERIEEIAPLAAAGERALASIEGKVATARDRELLALALVWNGRAQRLVGEPEASRAFFERAVRAAAALPPGQVATEAEVAARIALGELHVEGRDFKGSRVHFDRAVALCKDAIAGGEADRSLRLAHVRALISLGDVTMSSGKESAPRALKYFSRARAALDDPGAGFEADALDVQVLRCDLGKLEANMAFQTGQRDRAVELLEEHVLQARALIERDPGSPRSRWTLARGADVLARAERELGRPQAAVEAHRTSVEAWRLLREMEPRNDAWSREWAKSTALLADSLRLVGQVDESVDLHGVSIGLMESMMAEGTLPATFAMEVVQQELSSAEGLLSAGELRRARTTLKSARGRLSKVPPAARTTRRGGDLGIRSTLIEAELLIAEGRWPGAGERALVVMEAIQNRAMQGLDRGLRLDRARALLVTGAVAEVDGDLDLARDNRERSLGILDELRRERPKDPELLALRARALYTLGREGDAERSIQILDRIGYQDARLDSVRAAARQLRR